MKYRIVRPDHYPMGTPVESMQGYYQEAATPTQARERVATRLRVAGWLVQGERLKSV